MDHVMISQLGADRFEIYTTKYQIPNISRIKRVWSVHIYHFVFMDSQITCTIPPEVILKLVLYLLHKSLNAVFGVNQFVNFWNGRMVYWATSASLARGWRPLYIVQATSYFQTWLNSMRVDITTFWEIPIQNYRFKIYGKS